MNLIIDAGNTSAKLAAFSQGRILMQWQVPNEELIQAVEEAIQTYPGIKQAIIASVAFLNEDQLATIAEKTTLYTLNTELKTPFKNLYASPETLGADRIAVAAAAVLQYPNQDVLIIDAGTCITYDLVTKEAAYLGGAISPGLLMRYQALNHFTARLPELEPADFPDFIGDSTDNSIHSGVINGLCREIDGVIDQYESRYPHLTVILTGGDAQFLSNRLKKAIFAHSNFLLEGLNFLLEYNKL